MGDVTLFALARWHRVRLLIVEDSALIRKVTRLAFPSREHGVEFLRALRQRALHRETPVIVATSEKETSELVQDAWRLGLAAVVKKPWKPQELATLVQQACAAGRSKRAGSGP